MKERESSLPSSFLDGSGTEDEPYTSKLGVFIVEVVRDAIFYLTQHQNIWIVVELNCKIKIDRKKRKATFYFDAEAKGESDLSKQTAEAFRSYGFVVEKYQQLS